MDRSRSGTTAGVLMWTPAPVYSSPSSPEGSDFSWDDEPDEDFQSQMDENGIIGLAESERQVEMDQGVEEQIAEGLMWDVKTPEPEDGPPPALEEMSCHLSELLDSEPLSQPTGDDGHSPSLQEDHGPDDDQSVLLDEWTDEDDEDGAENSEIHRQDINCFPERDRGLDMTDEETEGKDSCGDDQRHLDPTLPVTEEMASHVDRMKSFDFSFKRTEKPKDIPTLEITEHSEQSGFEDVRNSEGRCFPSSHFSSSNTPAPSVFSHLTLEELMNNHGIEAETFPKLAFPDSRAGSSLSGHQSPAPKAIQPVRSKGEERNRNFTSQTPSARSPEPKVRLGKSNADGKTADNSERKLHRPHRNHQPPTPSLRKTNPAFQEGHQVSSPAKHIAKASDSPLKCHPPPTPHCTSAKTQNQNTSKTSHTDEDDVRKGQLSFPLPDFSKVEPRVRFPKDGYKPPKSRRSARGQNSHPDLPLVFKSPAEIVKEVLLSSTDGSPGRPTSSGAHKNLNRTVPEEFRCPQQASTLVQQLQEDYNRLLTKYAEAENTIDRLRLEAKVGLYSDPPRPSTAIRSGVLQEGSKVMTLNFPQAQRAEFHAGCPQLNQKDNSENSRKTPTRPSSVDSVSSKRPESLTAEHLAETLTKQTHRFQLQVDAFEELLKNGKLKPCEQIKGLSTLAEGQESLERAYLDTRTQYQMLLQRQGGPVIFDPNRDLEGQIFRSGMRLEELREWVEQSEQTPPTSERPLTPPPHSDILSASMLETEPSPESPLSAAHPEACVGVEVSSVSGESDADREEEEALPSLLHSLHDKHQHVEEDFSNLMDCYQSFKELPGLLDRSFTVTGRDSPDFGDSPPLRNESTGDRQQQRTNERHSSKSAQPQPAADCVPPSGPSVRPQVCDSMETRPEALCHPSVLPGQPGRERKTAGNRKTRSLTESREPGNVALKAKIKTVGAPPLDGVASPETDSGFMGSESSQLTPAVHSPLQQRAVVSSIRPSGPHIKNKPSLGSTPLPVFPDSPPSLDPPGKHLSPSGGHTGVRRREREEGPSPSPSASSSPLHWPGCTLQPWASSLTSQSEHGSDQVNSGEERAQDNRYPQPANQHLRFHKSPSLHVPYHHDDHLKAQSSVQLTNHQKALQSLQQEVNRLKERLEGSLSLSNPASPVRTPPCAVEDTGDHAHPQTSTPEWLDLRSSERWASSRGGQKERGRNGEMERKERGSEPRPALRHRSASLPRYRPDTDLTTDSEHIQHPSKPRPSSLRHNPVSPITKRGRRQTGADFGHHKKDYTSQQGSTSAGRSDESDDTELSRGPEPVCPHCKSQRTRVSTRPERSSNSPRYTKSYCNHCPLCGTLQSSQTSAPQPANRNPISSPRRHQPVRSLQRDRVGVTMPMAPPPAALSGVPIVPYMTVYPSALYFSSPVTSHTYSQPFNVSMSPTRAERSGVRGHRRRSLSMDQQQQCSLSSSLDRAISAARNMKEVSQNMAHSLSSGPQKTY